MTRWLGVDHGTKRVGLAVSDSAGAVVSPLAAVTAEPRKRLFHRIAEVAADYGAAGIVVGWPINMDGTEGSQGKLARDFAGELAAATGLDVRLWDERLTTMSADDKLAGHYTRKQTKARRDAVAAAVILQDFLAAGGSASTKPMETRSMKQYVVTPAMGKRLIGKAMVVHEAIQAVLKAGTLVVIAGTTNGYVAEEILAATGQANGFTRKGFRRGIVVPPGFDWKTVDAEFAGDVVLVDGKWRKGKTIFDVADDLRAGDVVLKGANALDVAAGRAAVYVGDPQGGTVLAAATAAVGRRVRLIVPVGLEKRVCGDIADVAARVNAPDTQGPGMFAMPGETFTELDAVTALTGARAHLLAGGGVYGAEGAVWLGITGTTRQIQTADELLQSLAHEPPCQG